MTMIDNQQGFGPLAIPGTGTDYDEHVMQIDDNVIIVNSESQLSQNHVTPKQ